MVDSRETVVIVCPRRLHLVILWFLFDKLRVISGAATLVVAPHGLKINR